MPTRSLLSGIRQAARLEWLLVWVGLAALYVPTLYRLVTELWNKETQAHGPMMLALSLWLMHRKWPDATATASAGKDKPHAFGWVLLVLAMAMYVVGRSQQILIFEIGSFPIVLCALLLLKYGPRALVVQWFPLFFMVFMIPLPEAVVTAVTMPMKIAVSFVTEKILFAAGYPIGRQGVILQVGPYQLLVADACAGLQTVLTLEAMSLFYLNVTKHAAALRNVVLALLIVPISFTANVIRVMTLTLVTYHLGDAAGQGFLHKFAGLVLFLSAFLLILAVDSALQALVGKRSRLAGEAARA